MSNKEPPKKRYECSKCKTIFPTVNKNPRCICGSEDVVLISQEFDKKEAQEIVNKFKSDKLLKEINFELGRNHLGDENLKATGFLVAVSGSLKNPKMRMSMAFTGDSAVGKDNLIETILQHMPEDNYLFLTSGTTATIEDDVNVPILALSEMNLFRDFGANKGLLEVVKQRTERGIRSMKKDVKTSHKTTKKSFSEQGTVFYGTTDEERDKEMETRFLFGNVTATYDKIKKVNELTCKSISDKSVIIENFFKTDSWVKKGVTFLIDEFRDFNIVLPYAKFLTGKVKNEDIFDHSNPRSMRDIKRLLALTCANTFLHAYSRKREDGFIISEIRDFIEVLKYSQDCFNQTYSGMDLRLKEVLDFIKEYSGLWCPRDSIEKQLSKSKNTIKSYCATLSKMGLIEGRKGVNLKEAEIVGNYDSNKIYYKRCQKGVKSKLIRCQISELKKYLEKKEKEEFDTLHGKRCQKQGVKNGKQKNSPQNTPISEEIDTLKLTPLPNFPAEEVKEV